MANPTIGEITHTDVYVDIAYQLRTKERTTASGSPADELRRVSGEALKSHPFEAVGALAQMALDSTVEITVPLAAAKALELDDEGQMIPPFNDRERKLLEDVSEPYHNYQPIRESEIVVMAAMRAILKRY